MCIAGFVVRIHSNQERLCQQMYLDNKYTRWYYDIISVAKHRITEGYTEKHHIIPESLGGSNHSDNLVRLTPKEHYTAHHLLINMLEGSARQKMIVAYWCMTNTRNIKITNRQYDKIRKLAAENQSQLSKELWKNDDYRQKVVSATAAAQNTPEYKSKMADIQNSEEYILKQSLKKKEKWTQLDYRKKQETVRQSKEFRAKLSKIRKENCSTPEFSEWARKLNTRRWSICHPEHTKGQWIVIENITQFCKDNNLSQGSLCAVARGVRKQHKGWQSKKH